MYLLTRRARIVSGRRGDVRGGGAEPRPRAIQRASHPTPDACHLRTGIPAAKKRRGAAATGAQPPSQDASPTSALPHVLTYLPTLLTYGRARPRGLPAEASGARLRRRSPLQGRSSRRLPLPRLQPSPVRPSPLTRRPRTRPLPAKSSQARPSPGCPAPHRHVAPIPTRVHPRPPPSPPRQLAGRSRIDSRSRSPPRDRPRL